MSAMLRVLRLWFGREDGHGMYSLPRNECPVRQHASPKLVQSGAITSILRGDSQKFLCVSIPCQIVLTEHSYDT